MTNDAGPTAPVLVCGADRSGTTLLYALLASHPDISMVRRTNMWRWFHGRFGDLDDPANLRAAIDTMSRYERLGVVEPDWERVRTEFGSGPHTYGRLFDLLHRHHAERRGRRRWGDKSLHSEYHADAIFAEFPDARVIHTMRDPRDRYASIAGRYEGRGPRVVSAVGRWLDSARAAQRNAARYPDRYLVVRFEDLLRNPAGVTEGLCAFIGERYDPAMLEMRGDEDPGVVNSSFGDIPANTISTAPIGRWRDRLDHRDAARIELIAGSAMRRFGYQPEVLDTLSSAERTRLRIETVPTVARVGGWRMQAKLERRRSLPPEHRMGESVA